MKPNALHHGHCFPAAIISQAVRRYFRFQLSLRDSEELLFERGVIVSDKSAVDEHGVELDVLLQERRDEAAAKRSFQRVLRACPVPRRKIVTDPLRSDPAAMADIPELANVGHVFVKAAARVNRRAENSHQPTRERERRMRGFRDPTRTQVFLASFGPIRQYFALKRHLLRASL